MFVNALGTALPEKRYTKGDCWEAFTASEWFGLLEPRSRSIAKLVLTRANGIDERWLSVDSLKEVFAIDPDTLHRRFALHAPRLAAAAGPGRRCRSRHARQAARPHLRRLAGQGKPDAGAGCRRRQAAAARSRDA